MMDVGRHPRIELLVDSEVESVTGFVGNFRVRIRRKPRYVVAADCNACGECAKVCPVIVPDEYQQGLSSRKAIYLPFPQAVPSAYALDMGACLGNRPLACARCLEACDKKCIDFDQEDRFLDVEVGSIVVATGLEIFDPRETDEYGYTRFGNVVTSMEFERLICAGGPTGGHLVRPSDRRVPSTIGFIQCVGSRCTSERGVPYCSNICCMNTVKETLQIAEHYPESRCTVFYTDLRAFGKGFEDLYRRSRESGVRYVRGLPGLVEEDPQTRDLLVHVENTTTGRLEEHRVEMVVLAVGLVPRKAPVNGKADLDQLLTLSHTADGFVLEAHPKLSPVDAPTRGVYFAGCVESPKDIKDSVTQAGAAAARAGNLLGAGKVRVEAITALLDPGRCNYCNRCARVCPFHAVTEGNKKERRYPTVTEAACQGCGTCAAECPLDCISMRHFADAQILAQVDALLADDPLHTLVAFACNWCSYAGGDNAGTSRLQYPPSVRLIRTMCSGRVDEKFLWHAFRRGAPMVLVSGCHFADCHYINAVTWTQRRVEKVWTAMEKLGIRPARLQLEWVSAAEGQKFARVMRELDTMLRRVTPEEVEETMRLLAQQGSVPGRAAGAGAAAEA
jgi:heterodisulfide reductase subunit A